MTKPAKSDLPQRPRGRPRGFDRDTALERAMNVFWQQGYEGTSVHDLTRAMDINPPSLYAAFGDKERLYLEAIGRYEDKQRRKVAALLERAPSARQGLERLLELAASEMQRSGGCMLVLSATSCSEAHLQDSLAERRAAGNRDLKARFDRAAREGELAAGTDTGALAGFYTTVLQGMSIQARDGANRKTLSGVARTAMRAWPGRAKR
jgi:AcrR family transcriptional regulator